LIFIILKNGVELKSFNEGVSCLMIIFKFAVGDSYVVKQRQLFLDILLTLTMICICHF